MRPFYVTIFKNVAIGGSRPDLCKHSVPSTLRLILYLGLMFEVYPHASGILPGEIR